MRPTADPLPDGPVSYASEDRYQPHHSFDASAHSNPHHRIRKADDREADSGDEEKRAADRCVQTPRSPRSSVRHEPYGSSDSPRLAFPVADRLSGRLTD